MIKNLITATMLATATPLMVNAGTYRSATTILTDGTPYSYVEEDERAEYYYVKTASSQIPVEGTTIQIAGYQYTKSVYEDEETGWSTTQIIDYYIITNNINSNLNEIEYMLTGNLNNNGIEYENTSFSVANITNSSTIAYVNNLINGNTSFAQLNTLRTATGSPLLINDAGETYADLIYNTAYNCIRFRNELYFYTNNNAVADAVQATKNLYTQLSVRVEIGRTPTPPGPTNYEVIDIGGLMFEILGMPFAWASIAFNLTLFPGTAYAINISRLFFAILGSLILIIILKKVLK